MLPQPNTRPERCGRIGGLRIVVCGDGDFFGFCRSYGCSRVVSHNQQVNSRDVLFVWREAFAFGMMIVELKVKVKV